MLLDRIEIDSHGPLSRVELGPLSHHLNVVLGAPGSGKTAISRFIRDSLIDREYPRGMLSGSAGRVVWVDQHGWIHCRREQDGTPAGRRSVEFETRGEIAGIDDGYADGWFDGPYRSSLASRTLGSVRIPESIVDGVMVDTTVSSVSRVAAACIAAGLDRADLSRLPFENETSHYAEPGWGNHLDSHTTSSHDERARRTLRSELADVEAELAKLSVLANDGARNDFTSTVPHRNDGEYEALTRQRDECVRHRDELTARRQTALRRQRSQGTPRSHVAGSMGSRDTRYESSGAQYDAVARESRLRSLHQRADSLRSRAAELQRWITELEAYRAPGSTPGYSAAQGYSSASHLEPHAPTSFHDKGTMPSHWQTVSSEHLQNRIRAADQEIVALRRVLADVRDLRGLLDRNHARATPLVDSYDWLDDSWISGRRYDHFVRAIDRYRHDRPWSDFYASAYQPLRPIDDLAMRIEASTRQLDWLLSRCHSAAHSRHSGALDSETWMLGNERGEFLEQLLRRVREQLRHRDYLSPANLDTITVELIRAVDHLTGHRRRVVESLAAKHRNWKRDFSDFSSVDPDWTSERRAATSELHRVEEELRRVLDHTASERRSQRDLPIIDSVYPVSMGDSSYSAFDSGRTGLDPHQAESLRGEINQLDREIAYQNTRIGELQQRISRYRVPARPIAAPSIAAPSAEIARLHRRREELVAALRRARPVARHESSLMELASRWLIRLSGGRHRVIRWSTSPAVADPHTAMRTPDETASVYPESARLGSVQGRRVHAWIDNAEEHSTAATTRGIACLAIRMAAGELLGRMGHPIPLVLETHGELFSSSMDHRHTGRDAWREPAMPSSQYHSEYQHWTREGLNSDSLSSAFADYSAAGRQLLILTEHDALADFLRRSGARHFTLHTQRIVHPHQPLWRDRERHDRYVGPHAINVDGLPVQSTCEEMEWTEAGAANRAFDRAWRETAGLRGDAFCDGRASDARGNDARASDARATDIPAAGATYRDGYYYTDQSSTSPVPTEPTSDRGHGAGKMVSQSLTARHNATTASEVPDVPFFLTVDSPIDAAPSIDAVAAQRLRRIGISHITHLMNQDSNRLADTLGLAGVDAKTVRRWQAECRLMCRVPQLRGFDARVLVGCGVNDPAQLAAIHPTDLLDRVKTFLATERGQRILLSGTSYELSRITSWIASANQSVPIQPRSRTVDGRRGRTGETGDDADSREDVFLTDDDFDQERYEVRVERRADRIADDLDELARDYDGASHRESDRTRSSRPSETTRASRSNRSSQSRRSSSNNRSGSTKRSRTAESKQGSGGERTRRERSDYERSHLSELEYRRSNRTTSRANGQGEGDGTGEANGRGQGSGSGRGRGAGSGRGTRGRRSSSSESRRSTSSGRENTSQREWKFYLERADDVVDAPSIGPRMTERLNQIGIVTVDDLLRADAADIAERLQHRRVDAETVLQWQQQTTFVCRVPMMRGHDAQFLVAAGISTAEELALCDPASLFATVDEIAHSSEGKKIARGGKLPDLEEVTEWIAYASEHRPLSAA